jgi:hypothetical protein
MCAAGTGRASRVFALEAWDCRCLPALHFKQDREFFSACGARLNSDSILVPVGRADGLGSA